MTRSSRRQPSAYNTTLRLTALAWCPPLQLVRMRRHEETWLNTYSWRMHPSNPDTWCESPSLPGEPKQARRRTSSSTHRDGTRHAYPSSTTTPTAISPWPYSHSQGMTSKEPSEGASKYEVVPSGLYRQHPSRIGIPLNCLYVYDIKTRLVLSNEIVVGQPV